MRRAIPSVIILCLAATSAAFGAEPQMPEMPKPQKEHAWLEQLAGEWDSENQIFMEPGQAPMTAKGEETARMIGGFWMMSENKGDMQGTPYSGILTVGYDAAKKKYVGTWIDSMQGYLWKYKGSVDDAGKTLTLETKGPCPKKGGAISNFKEVLEVKDKDHKVFTSYMEEDDGSWTKLVQIDYHRKK
jgi:uncharacterized protein DUF1579